MGWAAALCFERSLFIANGPVVWKECGVRIRKSEGRVWFVWGLSYDRYFALEMDAGSMTLVDVLLVGWVGLKGLGWRRWRRVK